ncbi:MAG: polysaccharide deacetylase family protein [Thermacetogeniaceae bacterium]
MRWIVMRRRDIFRWGLFVVIFGIGLLLATGLAGRVSRVSARPQRDVPIYSVDTREKKVAISFDAAWGADATPKLLEILKQHNVKTTFFLTGIWVKKYPQMVQAIAAAGHEIGNHSLTHPHFASLPESEIKQELAENDALIFKLTNKHTRLFRPPFGEYNNLILQTARGMGYEVIQWSVDSLDWQDIGKEAITDRVLKNIQPGAIVLFHNNAQYTPEALPVILDTLQQQGYQIVPVSDLLLKGNYYVEQHSGIQKQKGNQAPEAKPSLMPVTPLSMFPVLRIPGVPAGFQPR